MERSGKEKKSPSEVSGSIDFMINQDLIIGASIAFTILVVLFTLYLTIFSKVMPDHKEDDGKPFFPFDD